MPKTEDIMAMTLQMTGERHRSHSIHCFIRKEQRKADEEEGNG